MKITLFKFALILYCVWRICVHLSTNNNFKDICAISNVRGQKVMWPTQGIRFSLHISFISMLSVMGCNCFYMVNFHMASSSPIRHQICTTFLLLVTPLFAWSMTEGEHEYSWANNHEPNLAWYGYHSHWLPFVCLWWACLFVYALTVLLIATLI